MKKTMVSVFALLVLTASLLSGCGETGERREDYDPAQSGNGQDPSMLIPEVTEPNPVDGVVDDTDGLITEHETADNTAQNSGGVPGNGSAGLTGGLGTDADRNTAGGTTAGNPGAGSTTGAGGAGGSMTGG